jgi:hypothetical protein
VKCPESLRVRFLRFELFVGPKITSFLAGACAKRLGLCPSHTLSHFISSTSAFPENESDNSLTRDFHYFGQVGFLVILLAEL